MPFDGNSTTETLRWGLVRTTDSCSSCSPCRRATPDFHQAPPAIGPAFRTIALQGHASPVEVGRCAPTTRGLRETSGRNGLSFSGRKGVREAGNGVRRRRDKSFPQGGRMLLSEGRSQSNVRPPPGRSLHRSARSGTAGAPAKAERSVRPDDRKAPASLGPLIRPHRAGRVPGGKGKWHPLRGAGNYY